MVKKSLDGWVASPVIPDALLGERESRLVLQYSHGKKELDSRSPLRDVGNNRKGRTRVFPDRAKRRSGNPDLFATR
jgi:hypothetical protein